MSYKFNDLREATCFPETSARFYQTTRRHIAYGSALKINVSFVNID